MVSTGANRADLARISSIEHNKLDAYGRALDFVAAAHGGAIVEVAMKLDPGVDAAKERAGLEHLMALLTNLARRCEG